MKTEKQESLKSVPLSTLKTGDLFTLALSEAYVYERTDEYTYDSVQVLCLARGSLTTFENTTRVYPVDAEPLQWRVRR